MSSWLKRSQYGGLRYRGHDRLLAKPALRRPFEVSEPVGSPVGLGVLSTHRGWADIRNAVYELGQISVRQLVLCSPSEVESLVDSVRVNEAPRLTIASVNPADRPDLLQLPFDDHPLVRPQAHGDGARKLATAFLVPWMMELRDAVHTDDDVYHRLAEFMRGRALLERFPIVGWRAVEAEDHSAVHAAMIGVGLSSGWLVGAARLAFRADTEQPIGPTPSVYNLDYFSYLRQLSKKLVALGGNIIQQPFSPLNGRVADQEFGDVLAEGTLAWLHDRRERRHTKELHELGPGYWARIIEQRERRIRLALAKLSNGESEHQPLYMRSIGATPESLRLTLLAALEALQKISAEACHQGIVLLHESERLWRERTSRFPRATSLAQAAELLSLELHAPSSVPFLVSVERKPNAPEPRARHIASEILPARSSAKDGAAFERAVISTWARQKSPVDQIAPFLVGLGHLSGDVSEDELGAVEDSIEAAIRSLATSEAASAFAGNTRDAIRLLPVEGIERDALRQIIRTEHLSPGLGHFFDSTPPEEQLFRLSCRAPPRVVYPVFQSDLLRYSAFGMAMVDAKGAPGLRRIVGQSFALDAAMHALRFAIRPLVDRAHGGAPFNGLEAFLRSTSSLEGLPSVLEIGGTARRLSEERLRRLQELGKGVEEDVAVLAGAILNAACMEPMGSIPIGSPMGHGRNHSFLWPTWRPQLFEYFEKGDFARAFELARESYDTDRGFRRRLDAAGQAGQLLRGAA